MLRFPKFLRSMLKVRASEPGRFALHGLLLCHGSDGKQHAQTTDGRILAAAVLTRDDADTPIAEARVIADGAQVDNLCRLTPKDREIRFDIEKASPAAIPVVTATEAGDLAGSVGNVPGAWPSSDDIWPKDTNLPRSPALQPGLDAPGDQGREGRLGRGVERAGHLHLQVRPVHHRAREPRGRLGVVPRCPNAHRQGRHGAPRLPQDWIRGARTGARNGAFVTLPPAGPTRKEIK